MPAKSEKVLAAYDIGIHDIDLTIVEFNGVYYGFHKPGDVDDRMGNRLSISRNLEPQANSFAEGRPGKIVFDGQSKPTEGPEVIQLIGQNKWYVYGDPFHSPMEAWETTDFVKFKKIAVKTVPGSKHCSMFPITETEWRGLRETYPGPSSKNEEAEKDVRTLLPHAKQKHGVWRYNFEQPTQDWFKPGFNDSQWPNNKALVSCQERKPERCRANTGWS